MSWPTVATFNSEEILACEEAGITVTLPKPMTSGNQAKGRFVKADFRYVASRGCLHLSRRRASDQYRYTNP